MSASLNVRSFVRFHGSLLKQPSMVAYGNDPRQVTTPYPAHRDV